MTTTAPTAPMATTSTKPNHNGNGAPRVAAQPQRSVLQMLRQVDAIEQPQVQPTPARGFSAEQIEALAAPLDRAAISSREQGRGQVSYLKSWRVIQEANRIFGFDGWQRQTLAVRCVTYGERLIGREQKPGWGVTYTARVRISVQAGERGVLIREGTGAGHGIDVDLGLAHESAIKEAETDAMKRALVTFGNPFGLALYDKSQRQVSGSPASQAGPRATAAQAPQRRPQPAANPEAAAFNGAARGTAPTATQRPQPAQARPAAPAPATTPAPEAAPQTDVPLEPATIARIHTTLRALPQPQLEAFSSAFRRRFQIPAEAGTIADRIRQKQHHDWIEAWLRQQQTGHAA